MAQVIGESGRYVSQEAVRKRRNIIIMVVAVTGVMCAVWGFMMGNLIHTFRMPVWGCWITSIIALLAIWGISKWANPRLDDLEKEQLNWQRGTDGENLVARELEKFPDDFKVINDLTTPSGNLDHVVIGPTGVFLLDTKNWRGVVSDDGNGELVLNGKPLDKPYIRQFWAG